MSLRLRRSIHRRGAESAEVSRRNLRDLSLHLSAGPLRTPRICGEGAITTSAIFLSVTWLFCLSASGAVSVRAQDDDYQNAVSFVQQRPFEQSFPLLQRILDRSPNDLKARNLMGIALSAAGRREEPRDATCHWGLAEIAFAARDYKPAALSYEQSGDLAWKDSRTAIKFATSCLEDRQPVKAAAILEKIPMTLSGADANIQFQAGVLLARLEKYEAAARRMRIIKAGSQ